MKQFRWILTFFLASTLFAVEGGTKLPVPPRNAERLFFARDSSVIDDIKIASPPSLRRVVSDLRGTKADDKFPDEQVLLYISEMILRIAYSEKYEQKPPKIPKNAEIYSAIFKNVTLGLYIRNENHDDFFMQVLPCLAVFFSSNTEVFFASMKENLLYALDKFPDSVLVRYILGVLLDKSGFHREATDYLKAVHLTDIHCSRVAKAYADNLLKTNPAFALDFTSRFFTTAISGYMRIKHVEAAIVLQDFVTAEAQIEEGMKNPALRTEILLLSSALELVRGNLRAAAIAMSEYERNGIRNTKYFAVKIRIAQLNGSSQQAVQLANEALEDFPENLGVKLVAAKVCLETDADTLSKVRIPGRTPQEKAKAIANMALAKNPNDPQAVELLIIYHQKRGEWSAAFDLAEKYLKEFESTDIRITQIRAALELRRFAVATTLAEQLYRIRGNDEAVQEILVDALISAGRRYDAADLIDELLDGASATGRSALLYQRSRIVSGEAKRLADLRSCLVANPRNADCLFAFYEYYHSKGDFFNARHYLRQLVALKPNDKQLSDLNAALNREIENSR